MKRQRIELTIKDMEDGAFAMSLVDQPAIEEETILLSKQEIQLQVVNEEKRLIVGFALVPDKDIPRVIERNGKKVVFDIFFSKDTVKKTAHKFMTDMNLQEFTIDHNQPIEGVKVVESWVVEDPEKDKANHYGLKPKGGEWVLMSYVENDEVLTFETFEILLALYLSQLKVAKILERQLDYALETGGSYLNIDDVVS
jgi:hypothetical protein